MEKRAGGRKYRGGRFDSGKTRGFARTYSCLCWGNMEHIRIGNRRKRLVCGDVESPTKITCRIALRLQKPHDTSQLPSLRVKALTCYMWDEEQGSITRRSYSFLIRGTKELVVAKRHSPISSPPFRWGFRTIATLEINLLAILPLNYPAKIRSIRQLTTPRANHNVPWIRHRRLDNLQLDENPILMSCYHSLLIVGRPHRPLRSSKFIHFQVIWSSLKEGGYPGTWFDSGRRNW